jgi:hypothetical protein
MLNLVQVSTDIQNIQAEIAKVYPCFANYQFNTRFLTSGRVLGNCSILDSQTFRVSVNNVAYVEQCPHYFDTLWHECIHALDKVLFNGWGHGKTWKKLMREFGKSPLAGSSIPPDIAARLESKMRAKWRIGCVDCAKLYKLNGASHILKKEGMPYTLLKGKCTCGSKNFIWRKVK